MPAEWVRADWPVNVTAGTSTRRGGVSGGAYESLNVGAHVGDDTASVIENRRRLIKGCQLPCEPRWLRQLHGDEIVVDAFGDAPPAADAAVSSDASEVLVIMTADCLPVMISSETGDELAAVHCGWRGLAAGIVAGTLSKMRNDPGDLLAWLGPAISQQAFEVGDEVRDAFVATRASAADHFAENDRGRWQADLYGLARMELAAAGVRKVYGGGLCTYSDPERFFSFRRDGACGRMATFIYRR